MHPARSPLCRRIVLRPAALLAVHLAAAAAVAGPLDPPPGPVAPTHKTLTQVEPRTPISQPAAPAAADALIVIGQPGSYYLAGDITVTDRAAIKIAAHGVTLDLNGFTVNGLGLPGTLGIITSGGFMRNVAILNGSLTGFPGTAIQVDIDSGRFENLRFSICARGITNLGGYAGVYRGNSFAFVTDAGIAAGEAALVTENQLRMTGAGSNPGPAISAGPSSRISANTVYACPSIGITAGSSSLIEGNTISFSGAEGIVAGGGTRIAGNVIRGSGTADPASAAIRTTTGGATVEGNTISSAPVGIVTIGGSMIVRNHLRQVTTPFATFGSDALGPTVTPAAMATATSPFANIVN